MIQIDEFTELPEDVLANLTDYSKKEWKFIGHYDKVLIDASSFKVIIRDSEGKPCLVLGVVKNPTNTLCSSIPHVWVLVCCDLAGNFGMLREIKRAWPIVTEKYPILRSVFKQDDGFTIRFVEFFGFKRINLDDGFTTYEARN